MRFSESVDVARRVRRSIALQNLSQDNPTPTTRMSFGFQGPDTRPANRVPAPKFWNSPDRFFELFPYAFKKIAAEVPRKRYWLEPLRDSASHKTAFRPEFCSRDTP